jgi:hypothetical protein
VEKPPVTKQAKKAQAESTRERDGSAGRQTKKSETGETAPKFSDSYDPFSLGASQDPDEDDSGDEGPVVPFATNTVRTGSRIAPAQPGTSSQHFGGKRTRRRKRKKKHTRRRKYKKKKRRRKQTKRKQRRKKRKRNTKRKKRR